MSPLKPVKAWIVVFSGILIAAHYGYETGQWLRSQYFGNTTQTVPK